MQLKKIALVFLVVVMMLSCVGVLTLAQGDATPSLDLSIKYSDSIKKGDKYVVKPGDSFDVSIWIDSNSGVKGLSVELNYNPEVLDVTAYYLGSIFSKNAEDAHINPPVIPAEGETPTGELSCWIEQNSTESDNTKTGVFVTYTFKVKDSFDGNIQDIAFGEIVAWNVGWDFLTINTIDKTETIYAHKFGNPELLPGDCVTAEKHVYTCERCGEKVVADLNTPGGHTYGNLIEEVPATCVTPGFKEHYKCSVCEKFFTKVGDEYIESSKEDLVIANGGHKFTINHTEIPAFCEKNGVEAHVECELCHQLGQEVADSDEYVEVTKADLDIPALEHILGSIVEYVAPSAAKFGFEAHYLCTRGCGQYFDSNGEKSTYNDLLIDKLPPEIKEADDFWVKGDANSKVEFKSDGHIDDFKDFWFNGSKLEKDKDYTVREGSIIVTLTDSFLETIDPGKTYEIGIESVSGIAKTTFEVGHDYGELVDRSEPTCMTNGNLPYYYCGAKCCNTYFDANKNIIAENVTDIPAQLVLKALGHKPAGAMIAAKAPTCTEIGYTIACYKCRVCDGYYNMSATGDFYDLSADVIEIPALGHNGVTKVDAKAPDCENAGNVEHFLCERCGKTVNADNKVIEVVLSALGHNGVTKVEAKAPTCEDDGNIEHFLCERCGKTVNADNEVIDAVIPKNGHSYGELIAQVDPTCEGTGTEAYYVCSVCGQLAQKAEGAEDYTKVTADDLVIPAAGHKYGELIAQVDPTCEGTGVIAYYKCSVCEKTFNSEKAEVTDLVIPAKGHEYGDLIAKVPATTEKDGAIAHYHCSACGKYFDAAKVEVSSIVIPKLPKIVSSPEEPWVKGSDDSLSFVSDAKFEDFVSVKLNGALLSESDYKLEKTEDGKTKITLEPATLEKLEAADYTITITSVNGSCDAGFTVENSSAVLAIVIVVIAVVVIGAGAAAAIVVLKKKNLL